MSDAQPRRFPFLLTLSVLGNLVLLGLVAGIFLKAQPGSDHGRGHGPDHPGFEMSREDREAVRRLMHDSFEAGRDAIEARREAERDLVDVLSADPYSEEAARGALARLREADKVSRDIVADRMFDGLDELSPEQRVLVAKLMAGNLEKRGKRSERIEKWRERRDERLRDREEDGEGETP